MAAGRETPRPRATRTAGERVGGGNSTINWAKLQRADSRPPIATAAASDPARPKKKRRRLTGAQRRARQNTPVLQTDRATARSAFVAKHNLSCFVCNSPDGPWAKTGTTMLSPTRRLRWAICTNCTNHKSP
jgi:hypothetical protein